MAFSDSRKTIENFIIPPYRPQYQFNLAKSINQVFYCREHSLDRINTQDIICFAETKERLKNYRQMNETAYRIFIQIVGKYFVLSPNQKKTELPLMILTDTQTIFVRRIKRLKKLQRKQISQHDSESNSRLNITFSHNFISDSTQSFLTSKISKKSLSDLLRSKSNMISLESRADIYNLSYSLNEQELSLNLRAIQQTIKGSNSMMKMTMKLDKQEKQFINNLKNTEQYQLNHLICNYEQQKCQISVHSKQKQPLIVFRKKQSDRSKSWKQLYIDYEPNVEEQDIIIQNIPDQIQNHVEKQLYKYQLNVNGHPIYSLFLNKTKKKVREKAQEMLRSLGVYF